MPPIALSLGRPPDGHSSKTQGHGAGPRLTGECHADIIIQSTDLPHCPFILQFGYWLLLHTRNNNVFSSNTDHGPAHGLLQVLHLEEVAVGREDGDGVVIAHACGTSLLGWEKHPLTATEPAIHNVAAPARPPRLCFAFIKTLFPSVVYQTSSFHITLPSLHSIYVYILLCHLMPISEEPYRVARLWGT